MKRKRIFQIFLIVLTLALCLCAPAFAAGGDVAGAVEQTWTDASSQIKTVVDNVVFPALSMVLLSSRCGAEAPRACRPWSPSGRWP